MLGVWPAVSGDQHIHMHCEWDPVGCSHSDGNISEWDRWDEPHHGWLPVLHSQRWGPPAHGHGDEWR